MCPAFSRSKGQRIILVTAICFLMLPRMNAQTPAINPRLLAGFWTAKWIAPPSVAGNEFTVCHFRKSMQLETVPASFVINLSADNRYRLFVNGKSVVTGPARSDLANWNYETVDIAPFLEKGTNIIAATVWNFGEDRPYSQISFQTAFLLQGNTEKEAVLNTNSSWKVVRDLSYSPLPIDKAKLKTYIVTSSGEILDAKNYAWGFEQKSFDDRAWPNASVLWYAAKSRTFGTDGNWMLVPRSIPLAEETLQFFAAIRRTDLPLQNANAFLAGKSSIQVPANRHIKLLFDQSFLTNAYPQLKLSAGKNALVQLSYAEALVDQKNVKGNRDVIDGKTLVGISDQFIADGGRDRVYSPLFFRTFRYVELDIETKDEPLEINQFQSVFTGYPFKEKAYFKTDETALSKIWTVGWRTARLCAVDTYFDCPYYEQLQYVGDTRIQSMISLYVSGDERLMKKAIDDIGHSFFADGLTQSRYPSRDMQVIPTFSLWWVCMIHDFWMNRQDDAFIRSHLNVVENVLEWYRKRLAANGMLGPLSWWQFVDWSWPWVDSIRVGGVPPGVSKGGSAIISLQYAYTLQRAAQLMDQFGRKDLSTAYLSQASAITKNTYQLCWDAGRGLLADDVSKQSFSQHANILAVLTDAIPSGQQRGMIESIIKDKTITPCTYYFTFYLFEALKKVNLGDHFLDLLQPWEEMLNIGLSTFAENPEPTRSDCHAWSASPNYEFLSLVCGIQPASPGFATVLIAPQPGRLKRLEGKVPHPNGDIMLMLSNESGSGHATIELPPGLTGNFLWQGKLTPLKAGKQSIQW